MILYFQKIIIRRHLHLRWLKKTQNTFKSKDLIFTMFMHGAILFYTAGHYHTCLTYPPPTPPWTLKLYHNADTV